MSEPKKMLPKMTITGIPTSFPENDIIAGITEKNKHIAELVGKGCMLTLCLTKVRGDSDTRCAVVKMSPEIRNSIDKAGGYVYVGLSRCRAHDRFWVTQCYHCQKFGHLASGCPRTALPPVCTFCAGTHDSRRCENKTSPSCANCSSLAEPPESVSHYSSSRDCPVMASQRRRVIENTNFTCSKNL